MRIKIDPAIIAEHERRHKGMLLEESAEAMRQTVRVMDSDQKAHLRAQLDKHLGFPPKSSQGKPS